MAAVAGHFGLSYGTEKKQRLLSYWWPSAMCLVCFVAGAALYFYMPVASMTNPPMKTQDATM